MPFDHRPLTVLLRALGWTLGLVAGTFVLWFAANVIATAPVLAAPRDDTPAASIPTSSTTETSGDGGTETSDSDEDRSADQSASTDGESTDSTDSEDAENADTADSDSADSEASDSEASDSEASDSEASDSEAAENADSADTPDSTDSTDSTDSAEDTRTAGSETSPTSAISSTTPTATTAIDSTPRAEDADDESGDTDAAPNDAAGEASPTDGATTASEGTGEVDLRPWKLQLPTGSAESPDEIEQPELSDYSADPWFVPTSSGTRFRAPVDGVTTSGSDNPRSELREMDGDQEAAWDPSSGSHALTVDGTVTALPNDKPELVVAQIHDSEDDVTAFRVEGNELWVTQGDETHHHLVTDDFQLGTPFEVGYQVADGEIGAYYNGELQATIPAEGSGYYFKTGAYTQANCENSSPCSDSNYGETILTGVTVSSGAPRRRGT